MGRMQKRKGYRTEKLIEKILRGNHLDVVRVPLSGATDFQKGDLVLRVKDKEWLIEVKARKEGFAQITKSLFTEDGLWFETEDAYYQIELLSEFIKRMLNAGEPPSKPFGKQIPVNKTLVSFFSEAPIVIVKLNYETPFVVYKLRKEANV